MFQFTEGMRREQCRQGVGARGSKSEFVTAHGTERPTLG